MNRSAADRRYGEVLRQLSDKLVGEEDELLMELDELVGIRLGEAQALAVQRLFWTWRQAPDGLIDEALLPDGPRELHDYRQVADLRLRIHESPNH